MSDGGFGGAPGFPILSDRDLSFAASLGVARCNGHLFFLDVDQSYSFQPQGVWRSCQGDLHRGLVGHPALHGCPQDRHSQVLHLISLHPWTPQYNFYLSRNVTEILRLVQAFRHSDLTGHVSHKHLKCRTRFAKEEDKNSKSFYELISKEQALPSDWAPGGEVVPTDFTHKVAYFLKKYGEGAKMPKEETTVENNMEDEEVMEEMEESGNSGPQQKQEEFSKRGTNPPSKA